MDYKITEVLAEYEAQFGSKRYEFKVEGNPNKLSAFAKFPITVGQTITGDIVQKGQYWNFQWQKKETNANGTEKPSNLGQNASTARLENLISLKLVPALEALTAALEGKKEDITDSPPF